jgi:hypothetical protein
MISPSWNSLKLSPPLMPFVNYRARRSNTKVKLRTAGGQPEAEHWLTTTAKPPYPQDRVVTASTTMDSSDQGI